MTNNDSIYAYTHTSPSAVYPPILLLHGAGANHLIWPPEIRRLNNYQIHAIDLPGHGKSSGPGEQTIEAYADAIYNWMQEKRIHRAFFVGHSMGGAIALHMAVHYTNQVCGLALVGTAAKFGVPDNLVEQSAAESSFALAADKFVTMAYHPDTGKELIALGKKRLTAIRPSVFHGDLIATENFNISDNLEKISQPTLVLSGSHDQITPLRNSQYLATKIKQAELHVIPDTGHMLMLEKPAATSELLKTFIDENIWKMG